MDCRMFPIIGALCIFNWEVNGWRISHGKQSGHDMSQELDDRKATLPPAEWFEQKLDHFNPTVTATWRQKYFTNATFYKEGGPAFLFIGGEAPAKASWMVNGSWIDYAKEFNALCFQLEHRFYGDSHPTEDLSVENLAYLSSEQALADLAHFVQGMTREHKLPPNTKWVAFGGSYAGSLAAWLRLKYPHLVHAAVSTSGPLLAIADFRDYYGVVRASLATAGADCVNAIQNANEDINHLLNNSDGQQTIKEMFGLCDGVDLQSEKDVSNLYLTLADNVAEIVQYNKDNRNSSHSNVTIDTICDIMTNESLGSQLHRYAAFSDLINSNETCVDVAYDDSVDDMRNVSWGSDGDGDRQWTYQTCTEFGFFQTSSLKPHTFGDKFPLDFYIQQCSDVFGPRFNATLLDAGIERTNMMYGGLSIKVSNVVFVHGSIDPWHALGITHSSSPSAPAIFIEGTAHCANLYQASPTDLPQLTATRKEITHLIKQWLEDDDVKS